MGEKGVIELRTLCGYYCTVPTLYQLKCVTKEGYYPQSTSQEAEVWKGRYNGEVVALKVLRGPRGDSRLRNTKTVSMSDDPHSGKQFVVLLKDKIVVL